MKVAGERRVALARDLEGKLVDRYTQEHGVQETAAQEEARPQPALAQEHRDYECATKKGQPRGEGVEIVQAPRREHQAQRDRYGALEDHRPGYVADGQSVLIVP